MILHWLGDMFDPALAGYWGTRDVDRGDGRRRSASSPPARGKVDGIKISLLDKDKEIAMRRRLPAGVRMYTGDDFNYAELIAGDGVGSAPTIGTATRCSASSTRSRRRRAPRWRRWRRATATRFHAILAPTVPLSRHIFQAPTRFYKTGVVFMAWLNGHQSHFTMVGGQQSARSLAALRRRSSASPTRPACSSSPSSRSRACATLLALHGVAG